MNYNTPDTTEAPSFDLAVHLAKEGATQSNGTSAWPAGMATAEEGHQEQERNEHHNDVPPQVSSNDIMTGYKVTIEACTK